MDWHFPPIAVAYFVTTAVTLMVGWMAWQRRPRPGAMCLFWLMVAVSEWSLMAGAEVTAVEQGVKILFSKLEYLGETSAITLLLFFVIEYSGQSSLLTRRGRRLAWLGPLIISALVWTNDWHHWFWVDFTPGPAGTNRLIYHHGLAFWAALIYFYAVIVIALGVLLRARFQALQEAYRQQILWLMVSILFPLASGMIYLIEPAPLVGLDTTPLAFSLTGLLLIWNMMRQGLLDVVPIAHHLLIENLPDGVVVLDLQNRVVGLNPAARQMLWKFDEPGIGESAEAFFVSWPEVITLLQKQGGSERELSLETESPPHLNIRITSLTDHRRQVCGKLILVRELTQHRLQENALRMLAQTVEQSPASVVITDAQGAIRYVNPRFTQLSGYSPEEVIGCNPRIFKSGLTPPEVYRQLWETILAGKAWRGEFCNKKKNDELYWESATIAPVLNDEGEITHFVAIKEDITERKLTENLLRIQRDLGLVLNTVNALPQMAQEVLRAVCQIDGISGGGVYLPSLHGNAFELVAQQGFSPAMIERSAVLPPGSPRMQLLQRESPLYTRYEALSFHSETIQQEEGLRAVAILPIHYEGQLLAGLALVSRTHDELPLTTRHTLEAIAAQVGAVIARLEAERALVKTNFDLELQVSERTRQLQATIASLENEIAEREKIEKTLRRTEESLAQRVADQSRKLAALYEVILVGGQSLGMEAMLSEALILVKAVVSSNAACVHLWNTENRQMQLAAQNGLTASAQKIIQTLPDGWLPPDGVPRAISELEEGVNIPAAIRLPGFHAYLGAPIHLGGEIIGALSVFWKRSWQFPVEDIALFSAMADQLGIIMENVRLRQRSEQAAALQERRRLARDLHDSVTQSLHSLVLSADIAVNRLHDGKFDRLEASLGQLSNSARQALKEMRLLLYEMRLIPLDQVRLVEALRTRIEAVEQRAGVEVEFAVQEGGNWPRGWEGDLYAIAMEALNNSLKHARATHLTITLRGGDDWIELEIADDGQGFNPQQPRPGGMGLHNMAERAEKLGGRLEIISAPGKGTQVRVAIPASQQP